jgi:Mg-chelatase subunit ChlD
VAAAVARERAATTSRRDLARDPAFALVSPTLGTLDEAAYDRALGEDADAALALLADMAAATDERLRALARRLAGRVSIRLAQPRHGASRGVGRLRLVRYGEGVDLDVDASLDALAALSASRLPTEDLRGRGWVRPAVAVSLVIDRSGSMGGGRLAAAALAAAAVAGRMSSEGGGSGPGHGGSGDHSVLAFNDEVLVLKAQRATRPVEQVVDDLLGLRGRGPTDLERALWAARQQLEDSSAARRLVVLLSDCRHTRGAHPAAAARALDASLYVIAPAGDAADARALARAAGGRCVEVSGPSDVPRALAGLAG